MSGNDTTLISFSELRKRRPLLGRRILIIVENLPVPMDRRVWLEARTLSAAGAKVSLICPKGKGYEQSHETLEGIDIYRHSLPIEAKSPLGFILEYSAALFWETVLAWKVFFRQGIDVIHGCNPPDLIFLVAAPFRLLGIRYLFDHHDINPELYEAKFNRRGLFWRLTLVLERMTYSMASVALVTNNSYQKVAVERGKMDPDDVFVVRSGPDLSQIKSVAPRDSWKSGRRFLVGYVGVMGQQEGIDLLLESVYRLVVVEGREDVQFVLVGNGPALPKLRRLASELGLEAYVSFPGRVADTVLFEVLSTADVCVNPDRVNAMNNKSTMNKIMEYMALAKPIVQFDVKEGRVSAAESALYARANDTADFAAKISALLDDPQLRERMGLIGLRRVHEELSWGHSIAPLISAYCRILQLPEPFDAMGGDAA